MKPTGKESLTLLFCITALMVSVLPGLAQAQALNLKDCQGLAAANSIQAKSAALRLESAGLKRQEALAGYLPYVSLSSPGLTYTGEQGVAAERGALSATLSVKQPLGQLLPSGGLLGNTASIARRLAEIDWELSQLDNDKTLLGLGYDVRTAYVGVLKAKQSLDLSKEQKKDIEGRLLPQVRAKFESGVATALDVTKVRNQVETASLTVLRAENSLSDAVGVLVRLLGGSLDAPDIGPVGDMVPATLSVPLDMALKSADMNRTEVKRARLQVEQAELNTLRTSKSNLPVLTLSSKLTSVHEAAGVGSTLQASMNSRDLSLAGSLTVNEYQASQQFNGSNGSWSVGLGISAPLLDWGIAGMEAETQHKAIETAKLSLDQTISDIHADVVSANHGLSEASAKLSSARSSLAVDEENLKITRVRFDAGVASSSELVDAELAVFQSRITLGQAEYDLFLAGDRLSKSMGLTEGRAE